MPDKLWLNVPTPNRSEWIRGAIRQRLARDNTGLTYEYIEALDESTTQLRKVGINLSQAMKLLHCQKADISSLPINELVSAIKTISKDIREIRKLYLSDDE